MGDASSQGNLHSSLEFGVFLGEGKSAVFRLRGLAQTGIPETGFGSWHVAPYPSKGKDRVLGA